MPKRSIVSVIKTKPATVLADIGRLMQDAGLKLALPQDRITILKDNISWHFPYLSANTTPWQLEGVILALKNSGYRHITAVHNNTVVTDPYRGETENKLAPLHKKKSL